MVPQLHPDIFGQQSDSMHSVDRVSSEVDRAADEIVQFTPDLVRIPTVNPPGEDYDDVRALSRRTPDGARGSTSSTSRPTGRPEHTAAPSARQRRRHRGAGGARPGRPPERPLRRRAARRRVDGRSVRRRRARREDLRPRRLRHEGGHRRGGVRGGGNPRARASTLPGTIEISGTVDEESGGFAGVAWLARDRTDRAGAHRLRDHPRAARTSIASASATAASTGSR